jgi:hypothetical protein
VERGVSLFLRARLRRTLHGVTIPSLAAPVLPVQRHDQITENFLMKWAETESTEVNRSADGEATAEPVEVPSLDDGLAQHGRRLPAA